MATYAYDDFRVTFAPRAEGGFTVSARTADGEVREGTFEVPLSEADLERTVLRFARSRSRTRAASSTAPPRSDLDDTAPVSRDVGGDGPPTMDAEQLGDALADALLAAGVGDAYDEARRLAEARGHGLRLTLSLAGAPSLLSVPWEFLYRRPRFLASQRRTPLVRLLEIGTMAAPPAIDAKVRILGVIASPSDLSPLDTGAEKARIEQALAEVVAIGRVQLDWLEPATPRALRQALRDGSYHVVHYVGHSDFTDEGDGVLFLERGDEDDGDTDGAGQRGGEAEGTAVAVGETLLANLLADQQVLRLVVLNSCEGARTTLTDPYAGVATTLIALGVPAVVAMQFEISDEAAIVFAEELYTNLIGRQDPIDAAVSEARKAIYTEVDEVEWATPVLFVRDPDVDLFCFEVPAAPLPPPPPPGDGDAQAPEPPRGWRSAVARARTGRVGRVPVVGIVVAAVAVALALIIGVRLLAGAGDDDESTASETTAAPATTGATTTTSLPAALVQWPSLTIGATGARVEAMQILLTARDHPAAVDGFFDDETLDAVQAFETEVGIPVDGTVGRVTWQQLVIPVKRGQRGDAVRAAQLMLSENEIDVEQDGQFSLAVQDAVLGFQRDHGLAADGIVDVETWKLLFALAEP